MNGPIENCPDRLPAFERVVAGCPDASRKGKGSSQRRNAGFSLVVSMLFLTVLTAVAVNAMQASALDEKMAANVQHHDAAFLAAEAGIAIGLRAAANTALEDSWETVAARYNMNLASNAYCDTGAADCGADWRPADTAALQVTIEYIGDSDTPSPGAGAASPVTMHHYRIRSEVDYGTAATALVRGFYRLGSSTAEADPVPTFWYQEDAF